MPTLDRTVCRDYDVAGIRRRNILQYTGPTLYVAGGDPIAAGDVGLSVLEGIGGGGLIASDGTTNVRFLHYNYTTGKMLWFSASGTEASGNLSTYTSRIEFIGY